MYSGFLTFPIGYASFLLKHHLTFVAKSVWQGEQKYLFLHYITIRDCLGFGWILISFWNVKSPTMVTNFVRNLVSDQKYTMVLWGL